MGFCFVCHQRSEKEKIIKYTTGTFVDINYFYHNSCLKKVINDPKYYDNKI